MNLRRATAVAVLVGLAIIFARFGRDSCSTGVPASEGFRDQHSNDEARPNFNQQYAGWTFGRIMGVSIGPDHAPPPPVFGWK